MATQVINNTDHMLIPTKLPFDLRNLSHSSVGDLERCPELFRQKKVLGNRPPATLKMVQGTVIDRLLGELDAIKLAGVTAAVDEQEVKVMIDTELDRICDEEESAKAAPPEWRPTMHNVAQYVNSQVVPSIGTPVATQKKIDLRLSSSAEWTVRGYIDRIAVYPEVDGEVIQDLKVRGKLNSPDEADISPQLATYVAARRQEGRNVMRAAFVQVRMPTTRSGPVHRVDDASFSPGALRSVATRYAHAAQTLEWLNERYGPNQTWPTRPHGFHCNPQCPAYAHCPGVLNGS